MFFYEVYKKWAVRGHGFSKWVMMIKVILFDL